VYLFIWWICLLIWIFWEYLSKARHAFRVVSVWIGKTLCSWPVTSFIVVAIWCWAALMVSATLSTDIPSLAEIVLIECLFIAANVLLCLKACATAWNTADFRSPLQKVSVIGLLLATLGGITFLEVRFLDGRKPLDRLLGHAELVAAIRLPEPPVLRAENSSIKPRPYPWVSGRMTILGDPPKIVLEVIVRDYPPRAEAIKADVMSVQKLDNVQVAVQVPQSVTSNGFRFCEYLFHQPMWNNSGIVSGRMGALPLLREVTVVYVQSSANNGRWHGFILFRKAKDGIDYEEVLKGFTISELDGNEQPMIVKEARYGGKVVASPHVPDDITATTLGSYGVPEFDNKTFTMNCPALE